MEEEEEEEKEKWRCQFSLPLRVGLESHPGSPLPMAARPPPMQPPSRRLIRLTQFLGISAGRAIAGAGVIILITPCGCDYMRSWALHV